MQFVPMIGSPPRQPKFGVRPPGMLAHRWISRQSARTNARTWTDEITADSPMVTACYEAHLCMESMLAAFAELRGDDAEGASARG
jgi:hypothetical protein